ncbi:hypothetical protein H920_10816 [Fukomys damarensis]|uniref:Uncharacterized protein n=1 Tax=Fukomys damarensis TaxID=885580 RepID=A0A091DYB6_FUKDA|nr:hypothetical protein H920_10816 [Fukomys damarensis]
MDAAHTPFTHEFHSHQGTPGRGTWLLVLQARHALRPPSSPSTEFGFYHGALFSSEHLLRSQTLPASQVRSPTEGQRDSFQLSDAFHSMLHRLTSALRLVGLLVSMENSSYSVSSRHTGRHSGTG